MMAQNAQQEAELRHLRGKVVDLESRLAAADHVSPRRDADERDDDARSEISASPDLEALRTDIETAQKEADELRHHLAQTQEDARIAADMAEELFEKGKTYEDEIEALKLQLAGEEGKQKEGREREEKEREREKNEMQAVIEKRGETVRELQERCKGLEEELSEAEGNVEELRAAGQVCCSVDAT